MSKHLQWSDIDKKRIEVTKTLLINIRAIRDLLQTDGIDKEVEPEIMIQIVNTLNTLSNEFTEQLTSLQATHAHLHGQVAEGKNSEYMYFEQKYHNLHTDIVTMITGLARALVVVQERVKLKVKGEESDV